MAIKKAKELALVYLETYKVVRNELTPKGSTWDLASVAQLEALGFISESKNPTMKDIAEFLNVSAPSATSMVDTLVKHGDLERFHDETDRRKVGVKVTPQGKKRLKQAMEQGVTQLTKIFEKLDNKDIDDYKRILKKLAQIGQ